MENKTANMERGTQRGFTWLRYIGEKGSVIMHVIAPGGDIPDVINTHHRYFESGIGFYPFDDTIEKGEYVSHSAAALRDFDAKSWFDEIIPPPENCSIEIKTSTNRLDLRVIATTIRNNRLQKVTRRLEADKDPIPQIEKAYKYFANNCPSPPQNAGKEYAISTVGQSVLNSCKADAITKVSDWLEKIKNADGGQNNGYWNDVVIDKTMTESNSVESIRFFKITGIKQVFVDINLKGDHSYKEDETGATVAINIVPAETIIKGAKGQKLSTFLGIPGAEQSVVKTAALKENDDKIFPKKWFHLRCSTSNETLKIPEKKEDTIDDVYRDLEDLIGPKGYFTMIESVLENHINAIEPRSLRTFLSNLKTSYSVNLEDFGGPDVTVKNHHGIIKIDYCKIMKTESRIQK